MSSRERSFAKSLHMHGWWVVVVLICVLSFMALSVYSKLKRLKALENQNAQLRSLIHEAEQKTNDLRETAAPFFERAARSFPEAEASPRHPDLRQRNRSADVDRGVLPVVTGPAEKDDAKEMISLASCRSL